MSLKGNQTMAKVGSIVALLTLIFLLGCGGGGGGSDNSGNGDSSGSIVQEGEYNPFIVGMSKRWKTTSRSAYATQTSYITEDYINDSTLVSEAETAVNGQTNITTQRFLLSNISGYFGIYGIQSSVSGGTVTTNYSPSYPWYQPSADHESDDDYGPINLSSMSPGGSTSATIYLSYEVLNSEIVTVPAGTFQDALKAHHICTTNGDSFVQTQWYVKGLGLVRWTSSYQGTDSESVLLSYSGNDGVPINDENSDDGDLRTWYKDSDGDGYGDPDDSKASSTQPEGYVDNDDDWDDTDDTIYPNAPEICDDGKDNDQDGYTDCDDDDCEEDPFCIAPICTDADLDGYYAKSGCGTALDCNDGDDAIYPGAPELCDGVDNQCPGDTGYGSVDEGCTTTSQDMALIPSGCFDMGDAFNEVYVNELPVHNVCISSFYMDVHEVTNAEYAACVSAGGCTAPADSSSWTRISYYGNQTYDNFPVIHVNWNQANDFCTWAGKRLPTEAEWEYAARGGLSGKRYPWGDTVSGMDANYAYSGDPWDNDTSPVEYYTANGYGLYDMAGNVWEMVYDWYQSDYYSVSPTNDPPGPASGTYRVLRGGGWYNYAGALRVASRGYDTPSDWFVDVGFRCAGD